MKIAHWPYEEKKKHFFKTKCIGREAGPIGSHTITLYVTLAREKRKTGQVNLLSTERRERLFS